MQIRHNPLERDLEWHKIGFQKQIEQNINNCINVGLPFQSVETIKTLNKDHVNKIKQIFEKPLNHNKRYDQEIAYRELDDIFCSYMMNDKSQICVRNRAICCFAKKCMDNDLKVAQYIAGYQFASYMEQFKTIVKWGATVSYLPAHTKIMNEQEFLRTKTLYVTQEISEFLNTCMVKINQKFIEVNNTVFDKNFQVKDKVLLKFVSVDKAEEKFFKKNENYKSISTFFINEITDRINQETKLFFHLRKTNQESLALKTDQFVSTFLLTAQAGSHLSEKLKKDENLFISCVVRNTLFDLCSSTNSKESGSKNKRWLLLDEYDKAISTSK